MADQVRALRRVLVVGGVEVAPERHCFKASIWEIEMEKSLEVHDGNSLGNAGGAGEYSGCESKSEAVDPDTEFRGKSV